MNVFSSDAFLEAAKESYFNNNNNKIGIAKIDNHFYKTLILNNKKPVSQIPFMDYLLPVSPNSFKDYLKPITCKRISKVLLSEYSLDEKPDQKLLADEIASPTIKWEKCDSIEEYKKKCKKKNSRSFSNRTANKIKKLETETEKIQYVFKMSKEPAIDAIEKILEWKSKQYQTTNVPNLFAIKKNRDFIYNLFKTEILVVSGLYIGQKLIAAHAGFIHNHIFYYLLPTYDPEFKYYGPGIGLLEYMIEQSYHSKCEEFDFLLGDEEYKYFYANHIRVIGNRGEPDKKRELLVNLKNKIKEILYKNQLLKHLSQNFIKVLRKKGVY